MRFCPEHIGLAARDAVQLKDWYVAVLGAELVAQLSPKPPAFMLRMGTSWMLEIYSAATTGEAGNNSLAGWRHLALRVDSIEAAQAELARRGVAFPEPIKPAGGGGRVLFFQDPEGNLLHLTERTPDSSLKAP
jgi:glyoxylase I family protein